MFSISLLGLGFEQRDRIDEHALVRNQLPGGLQLRDSGACLDTCLENGPRLHLGNRRQRRQIVVGFGGVESHVSIRRPEIDLSRRTCLSDRHDARTCRLLVSLSTRSSQATRGPRRRTGSGAGRPEQPARARQRGAPLAASRVRCAGLCPPLTRLPSRGSQCESAPRDSLHRSRSDQRQATARGPRCTGAGKAPLATSR